MWQTSEFRANISQDTKIKNGDEKIIQEVLMMSERVESIFEIFECSSVLIVQANNLTARDFANFCSLSFLTFYRNQPS